MAESMDTPDLLVNAPASPGVPRAPRSPAAPVLADFASPAAPALADFASPAVREGSALAEPPEVLLARQARVPQAKRNLAAAFGDECGSWGGDPWMLPPSPGGSPPPLLLSPRAARPVQLADLSNAVKREKKKACLVGARLERTFSGYVPRAEEAVAGEVAQVAEEAVAQEEDPETLFERSDLPALSSPKRPCRLEMDIKSLSPLKGMHIDFDELQMYDCV